MTTVGMAPVAALLWAAVIWRYDKAWRAGAERSLWFVLLMFAVALTVSLPGFTRPLNNALSDVGGATWIWNCAALLAAAGTRSLAWHTSAPGKQLTRAYLPLAGAALVITTLTYVWSPGPAVPADSSAEVMRHATLHAGMVTSAIRWAIWLSFLTWALTGMVEVTKQASGSAARVMPGRLTGLHLGPLACRIGYGYVAVKLVMVVAWDLGAGPALTKLERFGDFLALLSILIIVFAATCDSLLDRLRQGRQAGSRYFALLRLRPLWVLLRQAAPDAAATIPVRGARRRLKQRVLNIRDRQLALRPYVPDEAPRLAFEAAVDAGLQGQEAQATAEAAWLEAARRVKLAGGEMVQHGTYDSRYEVVGANDLDGEVDWLLQVSSARRRRHELINAFAERTAADRAA